MLIVCCSGRFFEKADILVKHADEARLIIFMFDCG